MRFDSAGLHQNNIHGWVSGLNHLTVNQALKSNASSNLAPWTNIPQVAQLVEHVPEEHGVGGSIPSLGAIILMIC